MVEPQPIRSVIESGLLLVDDEQLRSAIRCAYDSDSSSDVVGIAEQFFVRLTTNSWPQDTLRRFASGWHDIHQSALSVAGLLVRLLRKAQDSSGQTRTLLMDAACEIAEIIPEDTGVDGTAHDVLYRAFARSLTGDDSWRLDKFSVPKCREFRQFVISSRVREPLPTSILMVAVSENWNSGEYALSANLMRNWTHRTRHFSDRELQIEYVTAHAGVTETGHFLHAIRAWQLYEKAVGGVRDVREVSNTCREYLSWLRAAFLALDELLDNAT